MNHTNGNKVYREGSATAGECEGNFDSLEKQIDAGVSHRRALTQIRTILTACRKEVVPVPERLRRICETKLPELAESDNERVATAAQKIIAQYEAMALDLAKTVFNAKENPYSRDQSHQTVVIQGVDPNKVYGGRFAE